MVDRTEGLLYDIGQGYSALDAQSARDRLDGYAVVSGGDVSPGGSLSVDVAALEATVGVDGSGDIVTVTTGSTTNVSLTAADSTDPRKDTVYVDDTGTVQVETGTAESALPSGNQRFNTFQPEPPEPSVDGTILAEVWVGAGATSLTTADIRDRRNPSDLNVETLNSKKVNNTFYTSNFGSDDVAVQQAIDNASIGDEVVIDPIIGGYTFNNTVLIDKRITVFVSGDVTANTATMFQLTATGAQLIGRGGELDGQGSTFSNGEVVLVFDSGSDIHDCSVRNLRIVNAPNDYGHAIHVRERQTIVTGNKIIDPHQMGITVTGSGQGSTVGNNTIRNPSNLPNNYMIYLTANCQNVTVGDNTILGGDSTLQGIATDTSGTQDLTIVSNTVEGAFTQRAMNLEGGSQYTVQGNTVRGSADRGLLLSQLSDSQISNNTVASCTGDGIREANCQNNSIIGNNVRDNGGAGVVVDGSTYTQIANNEIISNTTSGIDFDNLTGNPTTFIQISDNVITDDGAATQGYGIDIQDDAPTDIRIVDNDLRGNVTAAIRDNFPWDGVRRGNQPSEFTSTTTDTNGQITLNPDATFGTIKPGVSVTLEGDYYPVVNYTTNGNAMYVSATVTIKNVSDQTSVGGGIDVTASIGHGV